MPQSEADQGSRRIPPVLYASGSYEVTSGTTLEVSPNTTFEIG